MSVGHFAAVVFFVLAVQQISHADNKRSDSEQDSVCGPRCVQYVLEWYGSPQAPSLLNLVEEMQWPSVERGSSLHDIQTALTKRGVYSMPVRCRELSSIVWKEPVVVFFEPLNRDRDLGHFAVLVPHSLHLKCFTGNETIHPLS
jgi:hypothetical protein